VGICGHERLCFEKPAGQETGSILLEILGQHTTVEVERDALLLKNNSLVDLAPILAAPTRRETLSA